MSGIKQLEDGSELIIRLAEITGKETTVTLGIPMVAVSVRRLNIIELPLENTDKPTFTGKLNQVKIKPHEVVTLGITILK